MNIVLFGSLMDLRELIKIARNDKRYKKKSEVLNMTDIFKSIKAITTGAVVLGLICAFVIVYNLGKEVHQWQMCK